MVPQNSKQLIRHLETLGFRLQSRNKHYKLRYVDGSMLIVSCTPHSTYGLKECLRQANKIIINHMQGLKNDTTTAV